MESARDGRDGYGAADDGGGGGGGAGGGRGGADEGGELLLLRGLAFLSREHPKGCVVWTFERDRSR